MKKILGVVGSPRKNGNTHILVDKILEGAVSAGAQSDIVLLGPLDIKECNGCHACGPGKDCTKRDDMNPLYPRIAESDVIVLGTPIYWYGPTALMKCFLDRFVYFNNPGNRPQVRGMKAILAIPFEEDNPEIASLTVDMFAKSLDYLEMELAGTIIVPGAGAKGDVLGMADKLGEAFEVGREVASLT